MASIDNRIVEMKFDNAAFQTKVDSTIKSIERLDASLKLVEGTQGLKNIDSAAKEINFGVMGSALDTIAGKFSTLSIVGITTLTNIINRAVDAGIALGKSLSLDQVISGFREYETNMRSIQTILANTKSEGATLQQVNDALDILNQYSDQTIYNFSEMTRNIGTFTAAGVNLDTSVQSIKGIANLAAISGSSSEQASNAMYQLSQAISTGTLKLMDWNSVTNAGMGGKVFQQALFETGKALKTIKDVPIDQSFDDWTKAGNTFRGSLEEGWVTAEVLTTTLKGFTGELTKDQLLAIGYTDQQAASIIELGKTGVEAATKVRTLTQLVQVAREAVASGWSQSFRIILGDFESATTLFSGISKSFSDMIGKSADARNELLTSWSDLGGRESIIKGLNNAADALFSTLKPIKEAFQSIFPPATAYQLVKISENFRKFTASLIPTEKQVENIKTIFSGVFAVFEILYTVVKNIIGVFKDLFDAFKQSENASKTLDFFLNLADTLVALNKVLVDGGLITKIFDAITASIIRFAQDPIKELTHLKDVAVEVFKQITSGTGDLGIIPSGFIDFLNKVRDAFGGFAGSIPLIERLNQRIDGFKETISSIVKFVQPVIDTLKSFADYIVNWFRELAGKMKGAAQPGDFSKVMDAVNLGIVASIGGLLLYLKKGIDLDFGGILDGVTKALEGATGVLKSMQADLQATALLKIAAAIGILALALLVIASIDSVSLTKSLAATAAGLMLLLNSFKTMTANASLKGSGSFALITTGLIALSSALLIMGFAIKVISQLSVTEIAKGLTAITVMLTGLTVATQYISKNSGGMIRAGIGLIAISIALNILAGAVMLFSLMSWESMAQGLVGITAGLIGIALALKLMPWDSLGKGAALILVAISLNILAGAVALFATMSWESLAKGFGAVAVGLVAIALAMRLMPASMPVTAAGLLIVSASLLIIARAIQEIASLSWEDLAKGLVGIAGALIVLAVAANVMNGAIPGAIAIGVMSLALLNIAEVLKTIGSLSWTDIMKGLIGIAAAFAVIAISAYLITPVIPQILAFGAALLLIGIAIAAFGIGVNALARGFRIIAETGTEGITVLVNLADRLIERIPALAIALGKAILEIIDIVLEAAPVIIEQLTVVISHLIDSLIELLPKVKELIIAVIDTVIQIVDEKAGDIIAAGFRLLMSFLSGISENIGKITDVVIDIILGFISALTDRIGEIVTAGIDLLVAFLKGITDNLSKVIVAMGQLIAELIRSIGTFVVDIMNAGVDVLVAFLKGITDNLVKVIEAVTEVIATFVTEISNSTVKLVEAGTKALTDFISGISKNLTKIVDAATDLITTFINEIGENATEIINAGGDLIIKIIKGISEKSVEIVDAAFEAVVTFLEGVADAIEENAPKIEAAGWDIAKAILSGMTHGLIGGKKSIKDTAIDVAKGIFFGPMAFLDINSPSKKFIKMGQSIIEGLAIGLSDSGLSDKSAVSLAKGTIENFKNSLTSLSNSLNFTDEFNPTITPVLDLTNVKMGAKQIGNLMSVSDGMTSTLLFKQAQSIASTETPNQDTTVQTQPNTELRFEQNIYAPTELSTVDIYRQTRNQITLAKEELRIS